MAPPRIMLSAGEASGDRLGAGLARALRRLRPDVELFGMGGEQMAGAGVDIVQDAAEVAVVGFFEVLSHLPALRAAKRKLEASLDRRRPDLLVPIDYPDFNFILAGQARRRDVPVVYFVSPQIWAWRRGRVKKVRRLMRRMLVLFPFEVAFYREAGVPVTFVGNPVIERDVSERSSEELRKRAGFEAETTVVGLLPGSRRGEVERLLPEMLGAAIRLNASRPGLEFLIPLAPGLRREVVERHVERSEVPNVRLHSVDFPEILRICAAGVVASGTASLEGAIVGLPMIVVYRIGTLSYWISRALVRVDHIAMPNLVAGRRVVPELVQSACTPERIATGLLRYLDDPGLAEQVRGELAEVRRRLGEPGVFDRAAEAVLAELKSPKTPHPRGPEGA